MLKSLREFNWYILLLLLVAFSLRLLVRASYGEAYFWKNGYSLFYDMAQNIAAGNGLCQEYLGLKYAYRPPVYPLFLRAMMWLGKSYWPIIVLQSLIGAVTVGCSIVLGRLLFDRIVGNLAGTIVTFYPYFVMHDTAMQETGLFTCLTLLSVNFLLLARHHDRALYWLLAGCCVGLALLTRATLVVWVVCLFGWMLWLSANHWQQRWRNTVMVGVAVGCLLLPWLVRNQRLIGQPVLTTLTGLTLWAGNNAYTFADYPRDSIDHSVSKAFRGLSPAEFETLKSLTANEIAQNNFFLNMALSYIQNHKVLTLQRAFQKVGAAFSWRQNPARPGFVQIVYFCSYVPVLLLGGLGLYLSRRRWQELSLIYALFGAFILVTAVFFAHTSHRVYLDVYLIVFAAYAFTAIGQRWQPQAVLFMGSGR